MSQKSRQQLTYIAASRGIAAVLVVAFHATGIIEGPAYFQDSPLGGVLRFGYAGVDFFFVLSGFIILYAHFRDLGRPERLANYLKRRFTRVYPMYWAVLSALLLIYFAVPNFGSELHRNWAHIASSIALVPDGHFPVLGVAWTLQHEILFYLAFCLLILAPRCGVFTMVAWGAGILAAMFVQPTSALGFFLHHNNIEFLLGLGVAWLVLSNRIHKPTWFLAAGLALFGITGLADALVLDFNETGIQWRLIYGVASAALVYGLVGVEQQRRFRVAPKWLCGLGDASYSIYLVHYPLLAIFCKLIVVTGLINVLSHNTVFALLVISATAIGCGAHFFVERPLLNWLRGRPHTSAGANASHNSERQPPARATSTQMAA